ncbi:MFS transporter [Heyndrickxia vini]|uniref:MFS transporter n=1 Tax=Heyndrickxia vini TaxID=1476025 RepID=A0ABX7E4K7_9BACI|nr:MFS transporter [Heyndrickxia vini]QQZ10165.1 MFS transporter [Heyndrickxia vini]
MNRLGESIITQTKVFYGWYVVMSGFVIMFAAFSIINALHSLFLVPVTEDLGMSRTTFSLALSITGLGVAGASPFMGRFLVKSNMKLIMSVCVIVAGLGFASFSLANSALYFCVVGFLIGICVAGFSNIPISIMITNWFYEKKGMAMGIAFAGSGVGAAALSPLLSSFIEQFGWRISYVIAGGLVIVITLPFVLLFTKKSPIEKGVIALGSNNQVTTVQLHEEESGMTVGEAKTSAKFWLFIIGIVCFALVAGGVQMHIPAYLVDIGHPVLFAGTIFGLLSLTNTVGKLILGVVLDKFRTVGGAIYVGICMTIAMLALLSATTQSLAFVFAIAYGLSISIATLGPPFMTDDLFGKKNFGQLFGIVQVFFVATSSLGVIVSGFIYDVTNSYRFAWIFFMCLFILGMACVLIATSIKKNHP